MKGRLAMPNPYLPVEVCKALKTLQNFVDEQQCKKRVAGRERYPWENYETKSDPYFLSPCPS